MNGVSAIRPFSPPTLSPEPAVPLRAPERTAPPAATPAAGGTTNVGATFENLLGNMVQEVNAKQTAAGEAVKGLMSGQNVSLHQAVIAMEEASVSFQFMVEVRNKLLESYQELMRMHA
jgi:flagellar hook-basal body complex protein FliE